MALFQVVFNLLSFTSKKSELCLDLAVATFTLVSDIPWTERLRYYSKYSSFRK